MPTPSLPAAFFLADAPGLDFLNSVATPGDRPVEWLADGDALLAWLAQAGLVRTEVLDELRRTAGPGALDAVAAQARALREWFRSFVAAHRGTCLGAAAVDELEPLNRLLARDEVYGQIAPRSGPASGAAAGLEFVALRRWRSPDALLLPIAKAMADLLATAAFTDIKACEGPGCTLVFLDTTRGRARRWCSMAACGNRAKQQLHRQRARARKTEG